MNKGKSELDSKSAFPYSHPSTEIFIWSSVTVVSERLQYTTVYDKAEWKSLAVLWRSPSAPPVHMNAKEGSYHPLYCTQGGRFAEVSLDTDLWSWMNNGLGYWKFAFHFASIKWPAKSITDLLQTLNLPEGKYLSSPKPPDLAPLSI